MLLHNSLVCEYGNFCRFKTILFRYVKDVSFCQHLFYCWFEILVSGEFRSNETSLVSESDGLHCQTQLGYWQLMERAQFLATMLSFVDNIEKREHLFQKESQMRYIFFST